ncbi:MAG: polysaccharide biosynthesis C-terminal domain-containing protein [Rhizobiaceae bacterium]|uniref:oligosaccharide flippase family protein n=1 Tax=Parvibaculum sp. TaxID=2024848 RepID=UPI001B18A3C6|nr:polysaccharide biosynthesis C-terminal domain-containing protein [Parvibaculum sp.]MBO6633378.1 polysaccharide biosynthesis C-terminal domain-containing protein [Parvibaculum sp.]MBO6725847.1 polysaccharide biosynthesis C-terminal domain-containing protein [Rhizobiaceae bacterium]
MNKAGLDAAANYLSFMLLGLSAVLANFVIVSVWGVSALGAFNQVVAVYIVIAQFSVLGQQNVMLHDAAHHASDRPLFTASLTGALAIAILMSTFAALLLVLLSGPIADLLGSADVKTGLLLIAPALIFTSVVKVAMQTLNGLGRVRLYAVVQGTRPVLIVGGLVAAVWTDMAPDRLPLIMTLAEAGTMVVALVLLLRASPLAGPKALGGRLRYLLAFGVKSSPAGLLGELNTRVDYFVLGIFASDAVVGAYSFAAAFAEGFFMAMAVLRILLTPALAEVLKGGNPEVFRSFATNWKWRAGALGFGLFAASTMAYWVGLDLFDAPPLLKDSLVYYAILAFGVALAGAYAPFGNILLLANRPGLHSIYFSGLVLVNAVGNFILTPLFGPVGTASATMLAYVASAGWLILICRRTLGLPL